MPKIDGHPIKMEENTFFFEWERAYFVGRLPHCENSKGIG